MGMILSTLLLGLLASLSPATIVVFILVLGTARARINAAAFLIGWAISLTVVFATSYLVGSSRTAHQGPVHTALLVLEVLAGLALVGVGVRQWRRREEPRKPTSGWGSDILTDRLQDLGPAGAAVVGVVKQPWAITTAAAIVVVHHDASRIVTFIAFACFTVASTASVGSMYLFYARRPGEAHAKLSRLRDRAVAAGPAVVAVAAWVVGGLLTADGLIGLRNS